MCIVSAMFEYGQFRIPETQWNPQNWNAFQTLIEKAEIVDSLTNQPNCVDDAKLEWAAKIEERVRQIERELEIVVAPASAADPRWIELRQLKQRVRDLEQQLGI